MIKKIDLGKAQAHGIFGNPAPLGLFGLAISCAALMPIAFGITASRGALLTTAAFLLFFGFGCHLLAGLMDFANRNTYGGTIFTTFSFNWLMTSFLLFATAQGIPVDHHVILATEIVLFVIFLFLTYGFGFFSKLLFFFLLDIDLLYICKIIKGFWGNQYFLCPCLDLNFLIAIFTALLGGIGLWLALAGLINPISGKEFFKVGTPLFHAGSKKLFDFSLRRRIFDILYQQWKAQAFREIAFTELRTQVAKTLGEMPLEPDLCYLAEYGAVHVTYDSQNPHTILSARLTASGIDLYEQIVFKKYDF